MKKSILILFSYIFISQIFAQTTTPLVISNGGKFSRNTNLSNSFTIGEPVISTLKTPEVIITHGFQQPLSSPIILIQPKNTDVCIGDSIALWISVKGGGTLHYQWKKDGLDIPGNNDSIIVFNPVTKDDTGSYSCFIYNIIGDTLSEKAKLAVHDLPVVSLSDFENTCINTAPFLLNGGYPLGGIYTGNGVSLNILNPGLTGLGTNDITYSYTDSNGCSAGVTKSIIINDTTGASLSFIENMCINSDPIELAGGSPIGGYYFGPGVTINTYTPASAKLGINSLSYVYTNLYGCSDTAKQSIIIYDTTYITLEAFDPVCMDLPEFLLTGGNPSGGIYSGIGVSYGNFNPSSAGAGIHHILYSYTNINNCISFITEDLEVYPLPELELGEDKVVCEGTEIILDAGAGHIHYEWSHGEMDERNLGVSESGIYYVTVTNEYGCTSSDTINVKYNIPYAEQEICIVTVGSTGNNLIVWEQSVDAGIEFYNIYKESTTSNVYTLIGTKSVEELTIFMDTTSTPSKQSSLYKISIIDTCGNESPKSPYHKTIHLSVGSAIPKGYNLNWDHFEIENSILTYGTYFIYRGTSYANLQLYDSIQSSLNQYMDEDPPIGILYYQIAVIKLDACYPTGISKAEEYYNISFSNVEKNIEVGISLNKSFSNELIIYPNPTNKFATISFPNPFRKPYQFYLRDITGRILRIEGNIYENTIEFDRKDLPSGLYFIEIRGKNIYRGQILIE